MRHLPSSFLLFSLSKNIISVRIYNEPQWDIRDKILPIQLAPPTMWQRHFLQQAIDYFSRASGLLQNCYKLIAFQNSNLRRITDAQNQIFRKKTVCQPPYIRFLWSSNVRLTFLIAWCIKKENDWTFCVATLGQVLTYSKGMTTVATW